MRDVEGRNVNSFDREQALFSFVRLAYEALACREAARCCWLKLCTPTSKPEPHLRILDSRSS